MLPLEVPMNLARCLIWGLRVEGFGRSLEVPMNLARCLIWGFRVEGFGLRAAARDAKKPGPDA